MAQTIISRVELLLWKNAFGKSYAIQVPANGQDWKDVYRTDKGAGNREIIRFEPIETRHVRMLGTTRATQSGYSLWEFKVFP